MLRLELLNQLLRALNYGIAISIVKQNNTIHFARRLTLAASPNLVANALL
jgi:hypothetical protein